MAVQTNILSIPSFLKAALTDTRQLELSYSDVINTNIASTSSFLYETLNAPIKNTQQLNIDWSRFENHTFFSSAVVKTNEAFNNIINGYPFDGTKTEVEAFFEKLTGFEKHVFDLFPKNKGYLNFVATAPGSDTDGTSGTWISVKDAPGSLYPDVSKNTSAEPVILPTNKNSFSIEMQLFVAAEANDIQVICQKMSSSNEGFSLHLLSSSSPALANIQFSVLSGGIDMSVSHEIEKGKFNHICAILNKDININQLELFINEQLKAISNKKTSFGGWSKNSENFYIGTGSLIALSDGNVLPNQTFSGSIDELRVFHSYRTLSQQKLFAQKSIFATNDLKLYYKFNEPVETIGLTDADAINSIVLDSSGNSLHSLINNYTSSLRVNAFSSSLQPLAYEKDEASPVLFPAYAEIKNLNAALLQSGSLFDNANPNLITKLIPQHYLIEGAQAEGFEKLEGTITATNSSTGIPGQNELGSVQIMLTFLYIWAKFFDDMKLYVQSFGDINFVDYDLTDTAPANFLGNIAKNYGFDLPPLFSDSTIEQYVEAENIEQNISTSAYSLKKIQEFLLRRTLVSLPSIIRSKGTQHAIKTFLRAVGIDPDNSLRIKEFGGPTTKTLSYSRETKREQNLMLVLTSSFARVQSTFLSASRTEPGYPNISGVWINGTSSNVQDGLMTSGSFSIEGTYKFIPSRQAIAQSSQQSLFRLCTTGSLDKSLILNVVANSGSKSIDAWFKPGAANNDTYKFMSLVLPDNDIFDSAEWNIVFGRERNDNIGSIVSSSYFIRAAKSENGIITKYYSTSSFFQDSVTNKSVFQTVSGSYNSSGSFIELGSSSFDTSTSMFLNDTNISNNARETYFIGQVSNFRFWSKALTTEETKEHARNYKSAGVIDPTTNYNFVKSSTGSFEKLRMDVFSKQQEKFADLNGEIVCLDFSLNNNHMFGSGFGSEELVFRTNLFEYSFLSPSFDEAISDEKIRVRGFLNKDLVDETSWAQVAPAYEVPKNEIPTDDTRFSIEFSLIDALNRDIVTMFATFAALDNALGAPELQFSADYPTLEHLRNVYFNRISEKLNFRSFFEFFRWFDTSIGGFIEQLIPQKTKFAGVNFTVESHMLERHKLQYYTTDMYLAENTRPRINDTLLLQLLTGVLRKY